MKFNMTKSESALFLKRVLCLTGTYSKTDLIDRFISKIGKDVEIIEKEKINKAYQELTVIIVEFYPNVEEFLDKNNFEKVKIMHYYLVEKILT